MVIEILIIIGIILAMLLFKKVLEINNQEYPKFMEVSDDEITWLRKDVIADLGKKEKFRYLTRVNDAEFMYVGYRYIKVINQSPPVADK